MHYHLQRGMQERDQKHLDLEVPGRVSNPQLDNGETNIIFFRSNALATGSGKAKVL